MCGVLAWCLCIEQCIVSKARLEFCRDVVILFHAAAICWGEKGQPTLQLGAGQTCRSSTLSECCMAAFSVKHVLFDESIKFSLLHYCRNNHLGAAGAEELVKGDWPELRVLSIGWVVLGWCLYIEQHTASKGRGICSLNFISFSHAGKMSWVQRAQPTLQLGAGQSCRSLKFGESCLLHLFSFTCNEYLHFTVLAGAMTWVQQVPKNSSRVTGLGCSSLTFGGVCLLSVCILRSSQRAR
jgi:hypothetical protein